MTSTILVTGANGDIGRSVVEQAITQGKNVIAAVRNEDHFDSFESHPNLKFLMMHLDTAESVSQSFEELDRILADKPLDAVVHCAAIQQPACVEFLTVEHLELTFKVNTIGSLLVMQQAFPRLRKSSGNLVLASSIWGLVSGPAVTPYAPSKWALEALIQSARCETRGMRINISSANIGAVKSRMLDAHVDSVEKMMELGSPEQLQLYGKCLTKHITATKRFKSLATSSEKVAKKLLIIADAKRPRARYIIGKDAQTLNAMKFLLPNRLLEKVLAG